MENQILTVPIQKKLLISRNQPDQKVWEKISEAKSLGESQTNCEKYNGVKSRIPSTSRFTSLAPEPLSCYHLPPPIIYYEEEKMIWKKEHVQNLHKCWTVFSLYEIFSQHRWGWEASDLVQMPSRQVLMAAGVKCRNNNWNNVFSFHLITAHCSTGGRAKY